MTDLERMLELSGLNAPKKAKPITEQLEMRTMLNVLNEGTEEQEKARQRALDAAEAEPKKKVSVKKAPWESVEESTEELDEADEDLDEAAKPDFADIDDDGDTDETAKKAAADKDKVDETAAPFTETAGEHMRRVMDSINEWNNTPGNDYEDRGHIMDQPTGETIDNSLRDYLNAEPMKVSVSEDIDAATLLEEYNKFKEDK